MTIAYLILVHEKPAQAWRLLNRLRLDSPAAQLLIHVDKSAEELFKEFDWSSIGAIKLAESVPVMWGDFSIVEAQYLLLKCAIEQPIAADWLVYLSGACYPAQHCGALERFLLNSPYDVYYDPVKGDQGEFEALHRYGFRRWTVVHSRWLASLIWRSEDLFPKRIPVRFEGRYRRVEIAVKSREWPVKKFVYGSQWMALRRVAAEGILRAIRDVPEIFQYFRRTVIPDEACFHSIIDSYCAGANIAQSGIHYTDWSARGRSPAVLTLQSLPCILASNQFLVRKVDQQTSHELLEALDASAAAPKSELA